jgi:hypothetical protein
MEGTRCLEILDTIPTTTQYDRLYIRADGFFAVDSSYVYTGAIGRSILDAMTGGYNRTTIVCALEYLLTQLNKLAQHCVLKIDTPYVQGNLRTFDIVTDETKMYQDVVLRLSASFWKLQGLVDVLKITYRADTTIYRRLYTCSCDVQTIENMITSLMEICSIATRNTIV